MAKDRDIWRSKVVHIEASSLEDESIDDGELEKCNEMLERHLNEMESRDNIDNHSLEQACKKLGDFLRNFP
jgi:hypothetical protein